MTVEEIYAIPPDGGGWRLLPSGDGVKLGYGVTLDSSPLAVQGSRHLATNGESGKIQIGCHVKTFRQWQLHYAEIGKVEGYTEAEIEEYGKIIEFLIVNGRAGDTPDLKKLETEE